ncbi:unnamed protein product [Amoebophrya sp. A25]|nr:unnamed protein product [Amoebophrya sp. A25]|eukprot:GSA25T00015929001.1
MVQSPRMAHQSPRTAPTPSQEVHQAPKERPRPQKRTSQAQQARKSQSTQMQPRKKSEEETTTTTSTAVKDNNVVVGEKKRASSASRSSRTSSPEADQKKSGGGGLFSAIGSFFGMGSPRQEKQVEEPSSAQVPQTSTLAAPPQSQTVVAEYTRAQGLAASASPTPSEAAQVLEVRAKTASPPVVSSTGRAGDRTIVTINPLGSVVSPQTASPGPAARVLEAPHLSPGSRLRPVVVPQLRSPSLKPRFDRRPLTPPQIMRLPSAPAAQTSPPGERRAMPGLQPPQHLALPKPVLALASPLRAAGSPGSTEDSNGGRENVVGSSVAPWMMQLGAATGAAASGTSSLHRE